MLQANEPMDCRGDTFFCTFHVILYYVQGKLKYEETVTVGFDNMFDAFLGLFTGANIGKAVVKA